MKLPYGATDDEKAAALAKLSWAAARIKAGEPFAEVAREMSDDTGSATQGGDVGDKTDGFVPPFKAAADALQPGEIDAGRGRDAVRLPLHREGRPGEGRGGRRAGEARGRRATAARRRKATDGARRRSRSSIEDGHARRQDAPTTRSRRHRLVP